MASVELTDYERQRLENIKRNREMVAALNIHSTRTHLSSLTKRPRPQSNAKKEKAPIPLVRRESMRARGLPPVAAAAASHKDKPKPKIVRPRLAEEQITMSEVYIGDVSDCKLIDTINRVSIKSEPVEINGIYHDCLDDGVRSDRVGGLKEERRVLGLVDLNKLNLQPENIARVVSGRIMSVNFFPTPDRALVVVGNTSGNVTFWDVDADVEDGPGIYKYYPHTAAVSGIVIQPLSLSKMLTSSYDGFIRLMDIERAIFDLVYSTNRPIHYISGQPNQLNSLYFTEGRGECRMCDLRAPKCMKTWNLHGERIKTVDFNSESSNLMATSSLDGTACIWDVRNINSEKPVSLKVIRHERVVHSAYFSPTGNFIATTSDNRIKIGVLIGGKFEELTTIQHSNKVCQGMSFRGIWGWDDSYIYTGNMEGGVDVISITEDRTVATFRNGYVSALPWRFAAHQFKLGMLAGATSGGEVYIWASK